MTSEGSREGRTDFTEAEGGKGMSISMSSGTNDIAQIKSL